MAASGQGLILSTHQLGTIHGHFGSVTVAPAVLAAVTSLAPFERREEMG